MTAKTGANKFDNLFQNISSNDMRNLASKSMIKDIEIDKIDFDEMNEELNGYDEAELETLNAAMDKTKQQQVIGVYSKPDGRYQCYSGHRRIMVEKKRGKIKVTCQISELPDRNTQIETLMLMNVQRNNIRPLYLARQFKEEERILRERAFKGDVNEEIGRLFGFSKSQVTRYKKILELPDVYQELCKREDFPFTAFSGDFFELDEDKKKRVYEEICRAIEEDGTVTKTQIQIFIKDAQNDVVKEEVVKKPKAKGHVYKNLDTMVANFKDTISVNTDTVVMKDREAVRRNAEEIIRYMNELIEKCR